MRKGQKLSEEHKRKISKAMKGKNIGNKNAWKGGDREMGYTEQGYIFILKPKHPYANSHKHIFEHRLVMEKHLGRFLTKIEVVHHINGIKDDNRIENLKLFENNNKHRNYHQYKLKKK